MKNGGIAFVAGLLVAAVPIGTYSNDAWPPCTLTPLANPAVTPGVTPLVAAIGQQEYPAVSGRVVVFLNQRFGDGAYEVCAYDTATGKSRLLDEEGTPQYYPRISGRWVTWVEEEGEQTPSEKDDTRDVFLFDLASGKKRNLTRDRAIQQDADVFGNFVVWSQRRKDSLPDDVCVHEINKKQTKCFRRPSHQIQPVGSSGRIAWVDFRDEPSAGTIHLFHIDSRRDHRVSRSGDHAEEPRIDEDFVVWESFQIEGDTVADIDIALYDLDRKEERIISTSPMYDQTPSVSENHVVYISSGDVLLYDIETESTVNLTSDAAEQAHPDIDDSLVVWEDYRNGANGDIYMREI